MIRTSYVAGTYALQQCYCKVISCHIMLFYTLKVSLHKFCITSSSRLLNILDPKYSSSELCHATDVVPHPRQCLYETELTHPGMKCIGLSSQNELSSHNEISSHLSSQDEIPIDVIIYEYSDVTIGKNL